jgi:hypothetical protein
MRQVLGRTIGIIILRSLSLGLRSSKDGRMLEQEEIIKKKLTAA